GDLVLVLAEVQGQVQAVILFLKDRQVQAGLDPLVQDLPHIAVLILITRSGDREAYQQIFGFVSIGLQGTAHTVSEQAEIQANVLGHGGLPFELGVCHNGGSGPKAVHPIDPSGVVRYKILYGLPHGDVLVPGLSIAQPEFQGIQPVGILQEAFLGDFPGKGGRWEISPTVVVQEFTGAIRTKGGGEKITIEKIVIEPSEEGQQFIVGAIEIVHGEGGPLGGQFSGLVKIEESGEPVDHFGDLIPFKLDVFLAEQYFEPVVIVEVFSRVNVQGIGRTEPLVPAIAHEDGRQALVLGGRGVVDIIGLTPVKSESLGAIGIKAKVGSQPQIVKYFPGKAAQHIVVPPELQSIVVRCGHK